MNTPSIAKPLAEMTDEEVVALAREESSKQYPGEPDLRDIDARIAEAERKGLREWAGMLRSERARRGEHRDGADPKHRQIPRTWTAREIMDAEYREPDWVVPSVIPSGATLLIGAPKVGKSWLALALAGALSCGGYAFGTVQVHRRPVLLLALEDSPRRLKDRMSKLGITPNDDLHIAVDWPRGSDAIGALDTWLDEHTDVKVVIVDVYAQACASHGPGRIPTKTTTTVLPLSSAWPTITMHQCSCSTTTARRRPKTSSTRATARRACPQQRTR